ncbi:hypothetical protein [uncultured Mediterranean phage uvMED]|nr:hypothetical protein [uncultured Mediterranean phage uvMED]BAQ84392.1 hypothetical protein [uncultured Mediterranean phage uvMED]BAQ84475.1 hypothetical protein [uncultured Mediterranean phage uvMED]BAQ84530.1 hypothetical protein [uncultured Mediterranean phage uvMED]BAR14663.1 hypothetical protein [uncultured Mediterranean phage uvMED]
MYAPDMPKPQSYAQQIGDTLETQIELAPDKYAAEASDEYGRPAYAQLDLRILRETMMGKDGQPGLLELYENEVMPRLGQAEANARRVAREADISDVEDLGVRASEAFKAANPEQAALMDELNAQAMSELSSGASLPPALAREMEQQVRSAQAARGMGFGMADVGQEALVKGLQAEQLQRRRQGFAQQIAGMNAANTQDPFMAILGRPGVNVNQAGMIAGQGQGMNPGNVFNPESAYAGSLYANNFNAASNAAISAANNRTAMLGAGLGAAGGLAGGIGDAGGFKSFITG